MTEATGTPTNSLPGAGDEPEAYQHDPASAGAAAEMVDAACKAAVRLWDVSTELRALAGVAGLDPDVPLVRELLLAVSYRLRLEHGGKPGCDLVPSTETSEYAWPPRIAEVAPTVVALWRDVAALVQHPAAQARFNDLLFKRRDGSGRDRAVAAVRAYLAAARSRPQVDLFTAMFLVRAWNLARSVGVWDLAAEVCSELATQAEEEMASGQALPGVVLPMLAALAAPPSRRQSEQAPGSVLDEGTVDHLLETAFTTFQRGQEASQIASMMRSRAINPAELMDINRREVLAHQAEAASHRGLAQQWHLQRAIEIARDRGLTDLVRQSTADLQAIPVKDLGLTGISTTIQVPADEVERFLERFVASADWRDGLGVFLRTGCPTGELARLRQEARDIAKSAVFLSAVTTTVLGKDGLPRWTPASAQDKESAWLASCARTRAEIEGQLLAQGLRRIADRYGLPDEASLAASLSRDGQADTALAASLARALRHYWHGDYEACVHVAAPKVEAAARALLRELDEGIYRVQVAQDPGQYPGLYVLVNELEKLALDESWAYFLRWLLLGPPGMNIRNDVAHGFIGDIGPIYAALVLRAASMLITIVAPQPPTTTRGVAGNGDVPADLAELPRRERDDILAAVSNPVPDPIPTPWRQGPGGRATSLTASALRLTANTLQLIARRLSP